jgi:hypothetical protein
MLSPAHPQGLRNDEACIWGTTPTCRIPAAGPYFDLKLIKKIIMAAHAPPSANMRAREPQNPQGPLENRRKEHGELLKQWESQYKKDLEDQNCEFTLDGPSDWLQYTEQHPRILFLLKESHGGWWQPSIKAITGKTRFSKNVTLWKHAINALYQNPASKMELPDMEEIFTGDHSDIAFVEVKKLNQGKPVSTNSEIRAYADRDKAFLKTQIELIDPHVVLCANTIDPYDLIHGEQYDPHVELSSVGTRKCWQLNNRLVIDFFHPSCRKKTQALYPLLCSLITKGNVFGKFSWSKWFSNPPGL